MTKWAAKNEEEHGAIHAPLAVFLVLTITAG